MTYKTVNNEPITLALYFPENYDCKKRHPVFVCIHGGGWSSRKIFDDQEAWAGDYLGYLCRYYSDRGFISVSIDYRLMRDSGQADNYELLDLYEDCADAVAYLQIHSDEYGMDFENSVVLGESAGGFLAAALSTFSYYRPPAFKTAILINAITDFTDSRWQTRIPINSKNCELKDLRFPEKVEFLSPAQKITDKTCPVLLIHGDADTAVYPRHSQVFYDEMCLHGNEADLHWIKDTRHAFLLYELVKEKNIRTDSAAISISIINEWLTKHKIMK